MDADGPVAIKNDLIGSYSFDAANVYFHKVGGRGGAGRGGIEDERKANRVVGSEGGREVEGGRSVRGNGKRRGGKDA